MQFFEDRAWMERAYLQMCRIRAFESKLQGLTEEKRLRGAVHPCTGMEAIAVGVCETLREGDQITSTHRGHGHCIAKGLDVRLMMAEIMGRTSGYCRGKGGSMHITAMRHGMLGADAVVGGSLAIAVGAAYGLRLQGHDGATVAFFGDGASNQGLFHEAANLAAVLDAPVLFVCENDQWAISTPIEAAARVDHLASRAAAYGFPGVVVDGNDVAAVAEAAAAALERARAGEGPTLIEAKTFRPTPHSAAMPADVRPRELFEEWSGRDPIVVTRRRLQDAFGVDPAAFDAVDRQVAEEIDEAVEFALASEVPPREAAVEDVYAPSGWTAGGRLS
jgi:acetoin:2,6-dichlorophenolindophenol oxidoreductase subunit alpha